MRALQPLSKMAIVARVLAALVATWPILAIGAVMILPTGPHLLWSYEYRHGVRPAYAAPRSRIYTRCTYLGTRGLVTPDLAPHCPWVAILNADDWKTP